MRFRTAAMAMMNPAFLLPSIRISLIISEPVYRPGKEPGADECYKNEQYPQDIERMLEFFQPRKPVQVEEVPVIQPEDHRPYEFRVPHEIGPPCEISPYPAEYHGE